MSNRKSWALDVSNWIMIMLGVSLAILVYTTIKTPESFNTPTETKMLGLFEFFLSFVFSWLLTQKSTEKTYREKQKESAIRSYRHIKVIRDNSKALADKINMKIEMLKRPDHNMNLDIELESVRDMINAIINDIEVNISDWGDLTGDEIKSVEEVEIQKDIKNELEKKIENLIIKDKAKEKRINDYEYAFVKFREDMEEREKSRTAEAVDLSAISDETSKISEKLKSESK